jgi:hypothetical protein
MALNPLTPQNILPIALLLLVEIHFREIGKLISSVLTYKEITLTDFKHTRKIEKNEWKTSQVQLAG